MQLLHAHGVNCSCSLLPLTCMALPKLGHKQQEQRRQQLSLRSLCC